MNEFSMRVNDMIKRGWQVLEIGHFAPKNQQARQFYWARVQWSEE